MKTSTLVALASAQMAAATFGFKDAPAFSCPANTNNQCNSQQSTGFDWSSLSLGSFSSYGGFSFDGFSCSSSFGASSKRDILTGRTFQDKCITGTASSDESSAPSFGCGSDSSVSAFSVDTFQISVEFDCDLEFHYAMADGSTCKQTSSCSTAGTTVKNTQCGGAKNVSIVYPSGQGGGKSTCSIGCHSIGFSCGSASSTVYSATTPASQTQQTTVPTSPASSKATTTPASSAPSTTPQSTSPATTTTSSTAASSTSETTPASSSTSSGAESTSSSTAVESTTPVTSPVSTPSTTAFTTSTIFTTFVSTIISCAPTVTNCPAHSTALTTVTSILSTTVCPVTETETPSSPASSATSSGVVSTPESSAPASTSESSAPVTTPESSAPASSPSPEVITTVVVMTSTTVCPVTKTHTTGGSTSIETGVSTSTIVTTFTSTVCTKCTEQPTSAPVTSAGVTTTSPSSPATTAPCPSVLPQCMNTWLFITECVDNTDSNCYCPSSDFVSEVYACLSAHGASGSEISQAQTYFQGICAPHISSNPAIVTCASTISTSSGASATPAPSVPVTTVQIFTTIVVPCTETTGISSGSVIPSSSSTTVLSTAVTVPQVVFTTLTGASSASAALVQGTQPASAAAGVTTSSTPAKTTIQTVPVSNSTAKATSTSSVPFTGSASRSSGMAFGSIGAAVILAILAL